MSPLTQAKSGGWKGPDSNWSSLPLRSPGSCRTEQHAIFSARDQGKCSHSAGKSFSIERRCHRRFGPKGERREVVGEDGSYVLREYPAPYNGSLGHENDDLKPDPIPHPQIPYYELSCFLAVLAFQPIFLLVPLTEAIVTATIIMPPPIIVFKPGASPMAKNTHTGLNTGSMTAIRLA
jgi:hypothetical protein